MHDEIARYLLLFKKTTIIIYIYIYIYISGFIALHLKVIFSSSLYKYIVWLEMFTRKYVSGYEKLKRRKINWV